MKAFLKISCCLLLLVLYFILAIPFYPFLFISPYKTRFCLNYLVHYFARVLLAILSIEKEKEGTKPLNDRGRLIVCNHVSYLDILVVASEFPTCFVTSNEMKKTPGLGLVCILGGCVFVERRNRENIDSEVNEIKTALEMGLNVMFYPEAKSTNGDEVIPFKRSLFHAAVGAKCQTLPLCLNYLELNGEELTLKNRDEVFWYGEMTFGAHFIKVCSHKNIKVKLSILDTISIESVNFDSKALRDLAFQNVVSKYKRIN